MTEFKNKITRTGKVMHFWYDQPGLNVFWKAKYGPDFSDPVFLSTGLYFDTNQDESAWEVYVRTKQLKHLLHKKSPILGVIAGTFELGIDFWLDRNVVGKLLSVSMGVSKVNVTDSNEFYHMYKETCIAAGFAEDLCNLYGKAPLKYTEFRKMLADEPGSKNTAVWNKWKTDICNRLVSQVATRGYKNFRSDRHNIEKVMEQSKTNFWKSLNNREKWSATENYVNTRHHDDRIHAILRGERLIDHTGIIMDLTVNPVSFGRIQEIVSQFASPLGLNLVQLRLVGDVSFAYHSIGHPLFFHAPQGTENIKYPSTSDLKTLSSMAGQKGIALMPEISISTNAGGWYQSSFNVECAEYLCENGQYIPQDIGNQDYIPVAFNLIREIQKFTSSPYIHLGFDEREKSLPCFVEARKKLPDFNQFEETLGRLLSFLGVTSDRVIRWENSEKVHYSGRLGNITQCTADEICHASLDTHDEGQPKNPWFGTVNIRRGGPWQIYSTTRELASKSPVGIMAQLGGMMPFDFQHDLIDHRMIAFSMGTLDKPKIQSKSDFIEEYKRICQSYFVGRRSHNATKFESDRCQSFAVSTDDAPSLSNEVIEVQWKQLINGTCADRTQPSMKLVFRDQSSIATAVSMAR
jgi:hypothetical protein